MIHEAMIIECSGKRLALMEWSAANKLFIFSALATTMFFPLGLANDWNIENIAVGIAVLLVKILVISCFIAILESSIAKLRFFRLPGLLFTAFIINIVAMGLII